MRIQKCLFFIFLIFFLVSLVSHFFDDGNRADPDQMTGYKLHDLASDHGLQCLLAEVSTLALYENATHKIWNSERNTVCIQVQPYTT